jgi:RimK family alpha-L-glutamate ligase
MLLLTARPELTTNSRFSEAADALGVELDAVDAGRVVAGGVARPTLVDGGRDLLDPLPDAVVARVGNWRPDSVLALLEVAVRRGVATPNPPPAIRAGRDHWRTVHALERAGLPVPETLVGADPGTLASAAARCLELPVVVKLRRSRMGVGVIRCDGHDHLESVLDSLWRLGDEMLVQQYLPTAGESLRLLVVGDRVVAAARFRAAAGEWRSNAARGATAESFMPEQAEVELALAAARALGLGQCGVDLLPLSPPVVCEANPTPGFLRLEAATGIDVARAMVLDALPEARVET